MSARWKDGTNLQDRLERIGCGAQSRLVLRLAQRTCSYRDLIRRYSNDSML